MSIKDLFTDSVAKTTQYSSSDEIFADAESEGNVKEKLIEQVSFIPSLDYSQPKNFAKYGSAELYYKSAIERIYDFYPYDGSQEEVTKFINDSLPHERYILDNLYPTFAGYASFNGSSYIDFKGGPHTTDVASTRDLFNNNDSSKTQFANIYDEDIYLNDGLPASHKTGTRTSNLKIDYDTGVTVEFWLKNSALSAGSKATIVDLWNSSSSGINGRLKIQLTGASGSPFIVTANSASTSNSNIVVGSSPTTSSISNFSHYSIVLKNNDSNLLVDFYVNGVYDNTTSLTKLGPINEKYMVGRIARDLAGSTSLSGALDGFRFWKTARTAKDIGLNWRRTIRGGSNNKLANADLGVYYKFNEGITGTASVDSVVLDYSGRLSNGTWTNPSRVSGSAIVLSNTSTVEKGDPIIYSFHPLVSDLKTTLTTTGSVYDYNNNTQFIDLLPSWMSEEHQDIGNDNLKILSHIIGSYFDKIFFLINHMPKVKNPQYPEGSANALPFSTVLINSLGLDTSDLFLASSLLNDIQDKETEFDFEGSLTNTKNLIYTNLFKNIARIYKAKGTEKAIKNILRCFYVDDEVISLKKYSNNNLFEVDDSKNQILKINKHLNNNSTTLSQGTVFINQNPADTSNSRHFISASSNGEVEKQHGYTLEANMLFPRFFRVDSDLDRNFLTSSIMGLYSASVSDAKTNSLDLMVNFIREEEFSKNGYFYLSSSFAGVLTSSTFFSVYSNESWNLSVRVEPENKIKPMVSGASDTYRVRFAGYNVKSGFVEDTFEITSSGIALSTISGSLFAPKRVYVGARRENLSGALQVRADALVSDCRFWLKSLDSKDLKAHAVDVENVGVTNVSRQVSPLDQTDTNIESLNLYTLALHWNFADVTGSDGSGEFLSLDVSSGSADIRQKLGWSGQASGYLHYGKGFGFPASSATVVESRKTQMYKLAEVEDVVSFDMINILNDFEKSLVTKDSVPNYHFLLEKSAQNPLTKEMLNFFSGMADFSNIIGEPVNRYRHTYKNLDNLRQHFFKKVSSVKHVEKYMEYYKWFDESLSLVVAQMLPSSVDFDSSVLNVIESHLLERNKYETRFQRLVLTSSLETNILGIEEAEYNWRTGHAPLNNSQSSNTVWWKERAERTNPVISSSVASVNTSRDLIRSSVENENNFTIPKAVTDASVTYNRSLYRNRRLATPYSDKYDFSKELGGGVNFSNEKNIHFTYTALHPAGPVNKDGGVFVPLNVLLAHNYDFVNLKDSNDPVLPPNKKVKRSALVKHGRDFEDGHGYKNTKTSYSFPFNIISSSVNSGYNATVIDRVSSSIMITNVHNDVYGPDMEKPLQSTFTEYAVGGHQSRHIELNNGSDTYLNRPEAWKILLGTCISMTGAIGMVGADYPYPEGNAVGARPYPLTGAQKATFYRDTLTKRPVNIKNIEITASSKGRTLLGNYRNKYEVLHSVGATSNPRAFVDNQPALPTKARGANTVKTLLDVHRGANSHFQFIDDYSTGYLTGSSDYKNKTIIINRFGAPGGVETRTAAYRDFRGTEFSPYNSMAFRNLTVIRPFQGVSSSVQSETSGRRVFDIHGKDFGLMSHNTRHAGRFFRDSTIVTSPGAADDAFTEAPSFHRIHRNNIKKAQSGGGCRQVNDNANVQHQIPKSDRQYSWITASITHTGACEARYHGFMRVDNIFAPFYDLAGEQVPFFDYVSASQATASIYQNTTRIDLLVLDKTGSDTNTLGEQTISAALVPSFRYADRLNALLIHRGDTYGWNWRALHQQDHPILQKEHKQNQLSVVTGDGIKKFQNSPVSFRGGPVTVNYDDFSIKKDVTVKTDFSNEKIYFDSRELNDLTFGNIDETYTPFELLIDTIKKDQGFDLNWVLYTEKIFPSEKNLFGPTEVTKREGYVVPFWRDNRDQRSIDSDERTSFNDIANSQSVWILDAPTNFLASGRNPISASVTGTLFAETSSAGELQNEYVFNPINSSISNQKKLEIRRVGACYSRKHMVGSLYSSQNPSSVTLSPPSFSSSFVDGQTIFLGEALWQAGEGAFYDDNGVSRSAKSEPFYQNYSDFIADVNTISKDEAILAEFRISNMVRSYRNRGVFDETVNNTFEIFGAGKDSSNADFYTTYTNSDFLRHFSDVKDITELQGKEIKLTCKATIKFMPYEGFYPAQRTLDLVTEFSKSYSGGITIDYPGVGANGQSYAEAFADNKGASALPLLKTLFAPGVMYNSIKSGIAVDYPVINREGRFAKKNFDLAGGVAENFMYNTPRLETGGGGTTVATPTGSSVWDYRVPFEAALEPGRYLDKIPLINNEPHPSASVFLNGTVMLDSTVSDGIYELAAKNFFGETANFFLKNSEFTKLESGIISDGLSFESGSVYGARLKIRRSHNGKRYYGNETDSQGLTRNASTASNFTQFGAVKYTQVNNGASIIKASGSFALPQDPARNSDFEETFTMYSRPSAFGPPVSGRTNNTRYLSASLSGAMDSLEGFDWAFTPPYYNGECWVDFIFRPEVNRTYTLEQILSEIKTVHRRVDAGYISGSGTSANPGLIHSQYNFGLSYTTSQGNPPYGGLSINDNAMKLDSSLNLFGIEIVPKKRKDKFGNTLLEQNEISGKKWVIQPKWETPILNFANLTSTTSQSITPGQYTLPPDNDKSVPRGMWHQFGEIPSDPNVGVFLEIGDIPANWLDSHYEVLIEESIYNNNLPYTEGVNLHKTMKSLSDLFGFNKESDKNLERNFDTQINTQPSVVRLGELAEKKQIREAVVAIPYVLNDLSKYNPTQGNSDFNNKKFIRISKERFSAALKESAGSPDGDSLDSSGASIRNMVDTMKRYVLPPQFDFINFGSIDPIVMYFFEFTYDLDKNDLSYIWQNIAPRNYKKVTKQEVSVSHDLLKSELLEERNIIENDNLRWMVFKVKQKAEGDYFKLVKPQAGEARGASKTDVIDTDKDSNYLRFNWPYDFVSIVETAKIGVDLLFKEEE